ncbi:MAG: signal peptide peptidase SppA [Mariprofundaceae bacterium]
MKRLWTGLMRFIDGLRRTLINGLFIIALILTLFLIFKASPELPENAILLLDFKGKLVEQIEQPSSDSFPLALPDTNQTQVRNLVKALNQARDDNAILAVRLDLKALNNSPLAKLQSIRTALEHFKSSGKPILASESSYNQSQYYLAAAASTVFLHPMGNIELTGFSVYRNYLHSALNKLSIDVHVFRVGEYKSAIEPFIRDSMSEQDRRANKAWLSSLWEAYKQGISDMRHIDSLALQNYLDQPSSLLKHYQGDLAALLKAEHFVDELGDKHAAELHLAGLLKRSEPIEEVSYRAYLKYHTDQEANPLADNKIALIIASGPIMSGKQPAGIIGDVSLSKLIDRAREDDQTKAVVLRIDSPGGSALASETIRLAVKRLQQSGKPVIVSMGSMAASGGYWIAASADEIWAQPTTLTGSIGVFGIIPNFTRSLEKLGIHTDGTGTTAMAGSMRADLPLNQELSRMIQMGVDHTYQRFIHIVAQGRDISLDRTNQIAQGRVWSGRDAKRIGLVDQLGDLPAAIAAAAQHAGIAGEYQLEELKAPLAWPDLLAEQLFGETDAWASLQQSLVYNQYHTLLQNPILQKLLAPTQELTRFNDPKHIYAYSPLQ